MPAKLYVVNGSHPCAAVQRALDMKTVPYQDGSRLPRLPAPAVRALAPFVVGVERRLNAAGEDPVRADLRSLPGHLDRIDGWLTEGVIGGPVVNAADLQIATTTRLMLTIGDVRPLLAGRPAEAHAMELFAEWAGSTPAGVFPTEWLAGSPPA
ncbi:MAG: hypothetical protein ACXWZZ_14075 [Solirubrobacteraceae bacterium]